MIVKRSYAIVVTTDERNRIWHHDGRQVEASALRIVAAAFDGDADGWHDFALGFAAGVDALMSAAFDVERPVQSARDAYEDFCRIDGRAPKVSNLMQLCCEGVGAAS